MDYVMRSGGYICATFIERCTTVCTGTRVHTHSLPRAAELVRGRQCWDLKPRPTECNFGVFYCYPVVSQMIWAFPTYEMWSQVTTATMVHYYPGVCRRFVCLGPSLLPLLSNNGSKLRYTFIIEEKIMLSLGILEVFLVWNKRTPEKYS